MGRAKRGLPPGIQKHIPPGKPVYSDYRVPEGHPCHGCPMFSNPCLLPCSMKQKAIELRKGDKAK